MAQQPLFGYSPEQIMQARQAAMQERAAAEASRVGGGWAPLYEQARGLSMMGAEALGRGLFPQAQDPALQRAQVIQSIVQKYRGQDFNSPSVLSQMASEFSQAGIPEVAMELSDRARQLTPKPEKIFAEINPKDFTPESLKAFIQGGAVDRSLLRAKEEKPKETQPLRPLEIDLGDRVVIADPYTGATIRVLPKELTPSQANKLEGDQPREGFNAKTGAYTNQYGEMFDKTEMRLNRQGFNAAQDLLAKLNTIDAETVKQAESMIDYTEPGMTKSIGQQIQPKTVGAQTKIAASQLLEQIQKLPPGSASDADMRAAVRDFPGYGDANELANWVNRTKEILSNTLTRQSDLYGFRRTVPTSPAIDLKAGKSPSKQKPANTAAPAGVDPAVWSVMTEEEKALWR